MDELDSPRRRSGFADLVVDPHLSGKEDTPYGSILNEVTLCVLGASRIVPRAVNEGSNSAEFQVAHRRGL